MNKMVNVRKKEVLEFFCPGLLDELSVNVACETSIALKTSIYNDLTGQAETNQAIFDYFH